LAVAIVIPILAVSTVSLTGFGLYRNACLIGGLVQLCFAVVCDLE
jgi:hypothetical protein